MAVQVGAHGFDLTDGLREACQAESDEKLRPLAVSQFSARWALSQEALLHVAHLSWSDGQFHGDVTAKSGDMYVSIHQAAKKASEQIKKVHDKAQNRSS